MHQAWGIIGIWQIFKKISSRTQCKFFMNFLWEFLSISYYVVITHVLRIEIIWIYKILLLYFCILLHIITMFWEIIGYLITKEWLKLTFWFIFFPKVHWMEKYKNIKSFYLFLFSNYKILKSDFSSNWSSSAQWAFWTVKPTYKL